MPITFLVVMDVLDGSHGTVFRKKHKLHKLAILFCQGDPESSLEGRSLGLGGTLLGVCQTLADDLEMEDI